VGQKRNGTILGFAYDRKIDIFLGESEEGTSGWAFHGNGGFDDGSGGVGRVAHVFAYREGVCSE
jgi:hypothetical protein